MREPSCSGQDIPAPEGGAPILDIVHLEAPPVRVPTHSAPDISHLEAPPF